MKRLISALLIFTLSITFFALPATATSETTSPPTNLPGDADNDGLLTAADADLIDKYFSGEAALVNEAQSDYNQDGKVNGIDASMIRNYIASFSTAISTLCYYTDTAVTEYSNLGEEIQLNEKGNIAINAIAIDGETVTYKTGDLSSFKTTENIDGSDYAYSNAFIYSISDKCTGASVDGNSFTKSDNAVILIVKVKVQAPPTPPVYTPPAIKDGDTFELNGLKYKVLSAKDKTAAVIGYNEEIIKTLLEIPSTAALNGTNFTVTEIGDRAFNGCTSLSSITLPSTLTKIGNAAFSGCTSLTSINIPSSVTTIGEGIFFNCTSLKTVTFAENSKLTLISSFLFGGCKSLKSISIPSGVTEIAAQAFTDCTALSLVKIPATVKTIKEYAFKYCQNLAIVIYNPDKDMNIEYSAFRDIISLTVYGASAEKYTNLMEALFNWRETDSYLPLSEYKEEPATTDPEIDFNVTNSAINSNVTDAYSSNLITNAVVYTADGTPILANTTVLTNTELTEYLTQTGLTSEVEKFIPTTFNASVEILEKLAQDNSSKYLNADGSLNINTLKQDTDNAIKQGAVDESSALSKIKYADLFQLRTFLGIIEHSDLSNDRTLKPEDMNALSNFARQMMLDLNGAENAVLGAVDVTPDDASLIGEDGALVAFKFTDESGALSAYDITKAQVIHIDTTYINNPVLDDQNQKCIVTGGTASIIVGHCSPFIIVAPLKAEYVEMINLLQEAEQASEQAAATEPADDKKAENPTTSVDSGITILLLTGLCAASVAIIAKKKSR